MEPGQPQRYDYEYERLGTVVNFMVYGAFGRLRKVNVRDIRTPVDLVEEVKELLEIDYPDAKKVVLVWDNLNTHVPASLYKAFELAETRRLLDRLEIHYAPKQCLARRIPDIKTLSSKAKA